MTYAALREAGRPVGLYTSPHLVDVRERIVVDERPIGREAFTGWTERLRPAIERTGASCFEALTAIALADFAARRVEIAVVEVGLGGRLDSTNVVQPVASAVTTIAREHTEYLGDTLPAIAREKAGIAKRSTPFVIGEADPAIAAVLAEVARECGAGPVVSVPPNAEYGGSLGLRGAHQRRNGAIAAALLGALPERWRPSHAALATGFSRASLAGRFDCLSALACASSSHTSMRTTLPTASVKPVRNYALSLKIKNQVYYCIYWNIDATPPNCLQRTLRPFFSAVRRN